MSKSLIIIGCGPGGYATAEYAAKAGMTVTVFEKAEAGGTCLNRGCIPTKVYCHAATLALDNAKAAEWGLWQSTQPAIDFPKLRAHKDAVVAQLREGVETLMRQPGITLVRGAARLKDAHTVTCDGQDYTADNILIATGSHPVSPRVEGIDHPKVVDSTGLLALDTLPKRLIIIGAGVIGMEMASAFNAFGTDVTVVEFLKECLPMADSDLAKRLRKSLEKRGVKFYMQSAAKSVNDKNVTSPDSVALTFTQKGKDITVEGDLILAATGRGPNTEGLGLEELGIDFDRHGIKVDDNFETSVKDVYAIGDVNGRMQLAHAAEAQGRRVVDTLLGREKPVDVKLVPWAVFTVPELAGTGATMDALKADETLTEKPVETKSFYRANGKAVTMDATDGLVKVVSTADGKLAGCHVLGAHAADLVQEVSAMISVGASVYDLKRVIHIHPTLQELL
jgi:dihydrolipoamide dehydrogenase